MSIDLDQARPSVFVVEDDEEIAGLMRAPLEEAGFDVTTVGDGLLALDWLTSHRPDIVVTGAMLPGLDGFELTRIITAHSEPLPVVFFTAKSLERDRRLAFECGATDFVSKVEGFDHLVPRVRAVLDSPDD